MWPSPRLRVRRPDLNVLEIDESSAVTQSPSGEYRWHAMSERDFGRYRQRLAYAIHAWIAEVEAAEGAGVAALVAHDALLSPIVLADVERRREMEGRPPSRIFCFIDAPAVSLFRHESEGMDAEYPHRFLPMIHDLGIFGPVGSGSFGVDLCATASASDYYAFTELFPAMPPERIVLSQTYEPATFAPQPGRYADRNAQLAAFSTLPSIDGRRAAEAVSRPTGFDGVVVTGGRSAANNRLDALIRAAAHYEAGEAVVATLVVGTEDAPEREELETLAWDHLGLENVFFIGQKGQRELAALFDCADVGVFPALTDVGGQLLLECLACATPVIGIESGRGSDLVSDAVGTVVADSDDSAQLAISLGGAVAIAINGRWKQSKGPVAAEWVAVNFTARRQVEHLLAMIDGLPATAEPKDRPVPANSSVPVQARR